MEEAKNTLSYRDSFYEEKEEAEAIDWLIETARKAVELEEEIESHAPDGRNHTNAQYNALLNERNNYRNTIECMRSEIQYALFASNSDHVKRHYLENALRKVEENLLGGK